MWGETRFVLRKPLLGWRAKCVSDSPYHHSSTSTSGGSKSWCRQLAAISSSSSSSFLLLPRIYFLATVCGRRSEALRRNFTSRRLPPPPPPVGKSWLLAPSKDPEVIPFTSSLSLSLSFLLPRIKTLRTGSRKLSSSSFCVRGEYSVPSVCCWKKRGPRKINADVLVSRPLFPFSTEEEEEGEEKEEGKNTLTNGPPSVATEKGETTSHFHPEKGSRNRTKIAAAINHTYSFP